MHPARLPIRAVSSEGRAGLLACGYLEKRQADGDDVASKFEGGYSVSQKHHGGLSCLKSGW